MGTESAASVCDARFAIAPIRSKNLGSQPQDAEPHFIRNASNKAIVLEGKVCVREQLWRLLSVRCSGTIMIIAAHCMHGMHDVNTQSQAQLGIEANESVHTHNIECLRSFR